MEESDTDDPSDPTLSADGLPSAQLLDGQSTDFAGNPDYPIAQLTAVKLRGLERDLNRTVSGRWEFAHFAYSDITTAAKYFWDFGPISTLGWEKARQLNRNYTIEDSRNGGCTAKDLSLSTALLHLYPAPFQTQPGRRNIYSPNAPSIPRMPPLPPLI